MKVSKKRDENGRSTYCVSIHDNDPRHRMRLALAFLYPITKQFRCLGDIHTWIFESDEKDFNLYRLALRGIEGDKTPLCVTDPSRDPSEDPTSRRSPQIERAGLDPVGAQG